MEFIGLDETEDRGSSAATPLVVTPNIAEKHNVNEMLGRAFDLDVKALRTWINNVVKQVLPHDAMICTHSIRHSFGYEVAQIVSNGIPHAYLESITTPRKNVRSKIFSRLVESEGLVFLDASRLSNNDQDCLSEFRLSGCKNLVGYSYRTQEKYSAVTNAAFFNVEDEGLRKYDEIRRVLMPSLHTILSDLSNETAEVTDIRFNQQRSLIAKERPVADLIVQGRANKEIARILDMNERTVKQHVCNLMLKLDVGNRTALAVVLYKILEEKM